MHFSNLLLATLPLLVPQADARAYTRRAGHHAQMAREAHEALVAREPSGPKAHLGFPPASGLDGIAGIGKRDIEERDPSGAKAHLGFPPASGLSGIAGINKRDGAPKKIRKRKTCKAKTTALPTASATESSSASIGNILKASPSSKTQKSKPSATSSTHGNAHTTSSSARAEPTSAEYSATSAAWSAVSSASSAWAAESPTATSASAAASSSSASTPPFSNLASFFPTGEGRSRWSTVTSWVQALSFDSALTPLTSGKLPSSGPAPDGSAALIANYPAGTFKYSSSTGHGYSFYSGGAVDSVDITGAKEAVFSYSVYFPSGFDFVKGGKLPGLYGGSSLEEAKSCSGGRQDSRDKCFSTRLMWRASGAGEIYNYLPPDKWSESYCSTAPFSKCDSSYGESIGRGAFTFATGQWTTVAIRVKLNDYGSANGEQELYVNGVSVINLSGLTISDDPATKFYGIMAQTFFGGSDSTWASPSDQSAYFKDWTLAVLS